MDREEIEKRLTEAIARYERAVKLEQWGMARKAEQEVTKLRREIMEEVITKALRDTDFLISDLRDIHRLAISKKNDALLILALDFIERARHMHDTLAQLENV